MGTFLLSCVVSVMNEFKPGTPNNSRHADSVSLTASSDLVLLFFKTKVVTSLFYYWSTTGEHNSSTYIPDSFFFFLLNSWIAGESWPVAACAFLQLWSSQWSSVLGLMLSAVGHRDGKVTFPAASSQPQTGCGKHTGSYVDCHLYKTLFKL